MSGQNGLEVYRQHVGAQQKYSYFLLAAVGACVGFALAQTKDAMLGAYQIPLGLALFSWGLSFWCGCAHLRAVQATLYANMGLIRMQSGTDPLVGRDRASMAYGETVIREIADSHSSRSARASSWQFRFFIIGVSAYIFWHVWQMAARTPAL